MTSFDFESKPPTSPADSVKDPEVSRRLEQMFGSSLVGEWPELAQLAPSAPRRTRARGRWFVLAVGGLIALGVWGTRTLLEPGLQRTAAQERERYATDLKAFVKDGDLEHARQYFRLVRDAADTARPIDPNEAHLELLVEAEALLYRYHDADVERLHRITPILAGLVADARRHSPRLTMASLTIASRAERQARLSDLERLHNELPNENEVEHLLATARERAALARSLAANVSKSGVPGARLGTESSVAPSADVGALEAPNAQPSKVNEADPLVQVTRETWIRSAKLGPAWLAHRLEQAWFEQLQGQPESARVIASQMVRTDPDSIWSKLAITAFSPPKNPEVVSVRGDAGVPAPTPVQIHYELLQKTLSAQQHGDAAQANRHLRDAMLTIHYQLPFLLDAFDWLLAAQQPNLARELASAPEWPRDSQVATQELGLLPPVAAEKRADSTAASGKKPSRTSASRANQRQGSAGRNLRQRRSK